MIHDNQNIEEEISHKDQRYPKFGLDNLTALQQ